MLLSYTLTFDDVKQAQAVYTEVEGLRARQKARRSPSLSTIIFIVLSIVVSLLIIHLAEPTPASTFRPPYMVMVAIVLPLILTALFVTCGNAVASYRAGAMSLGKLLWRLTLTMLSPLLCLIIYFGLETLGRTMNPMPRSRLVDWPMLYVPHLFWTIYVLIFAWMLIQFRTNQVTKAWEQATHLHRPQQVNVGAIGVQFQDALSSRFYQWLAIESQTESSDLFILWRSMNQFEMVPKRACANETEIGQLRALLSHHVRDPQAKSAFPVSVPGSTPPPVTASQ